MSGSGAVEEAPDGVTEHGGVDPAAPEPAGEEAPYGQPGKPFDRRSPYYYGFVGALGALTAFWLFQAIVGIGSVLMLVVVSFFLAAGLNPAVMFLERRGLRRSLSVTVVILAALGLVALFVVAIVPVITDQVQAITKNAPEWLDQLQKNKRIQRIDDEYHIIEKIEKKAQRGRPRRRGLRQRRRYRAQGSSPGSSTPSSSSS
ncbi:AI-2E family transporter [Nocardioides convexus]|uniref:AI-2E family transporter n=1 Tax=Nocardioides convexus TaxID=2712224 RepID=UPI002418B6DB|nr:AI-2E family transporter [Nocardioides convexus]